MELCVRKHAGTFVPNLVPEPVLCAPVMPSVHFHEVLGSHVGQEAEVVVQPSVEGLGAF